MKLFKILMCLLMVASLKANGQQTEEQKKAQDWANFQKAVEERYHNDWAWLTRYAGDNLKMPAPAPSEKRVVYIGDSITDNWLNADPDFFKSTGYVNRGIGGQTTPQMLVRFREDVINLKPKVVIILAGINDIAGNTGPSVLENVAGNVFSMAELAKAANIKVILCSVLPAYAIGWKPGVDPKEPIVKLNNMLKAYAAKNKLTYVDYYSAMVDDKLALKDGLGTDGLHPNLAGYKIMEPLANEAIKRTLK